MRTAPLLDLVYPRFCLACGDGLVESRFYWLCPACLARIEPLGPHPCPVCAGDLGPGAPPSACRDCRRLSPRFDAAIAVGRYEGLLGDLVTGLKYARDVTLAYPLGELLSQTVAGWDRAGSAQAVVPVPLAFSRRVRRGFNQAESIAVEVARRLDLPLMRFSLRRRAAGPAQASLPRTTRLSAQKGSMDARDPVRLLDPLLARLPPAMADVARAALPGVRGRAVLLVDDVLTTGATASEAARALKAAGSREVLAAVVARA